MKRLTTIILAAALLMQILAGCGNNADDYEEKQKSLRTENTMYACNGNGEIEEVTFVLEGKIPSENREEGTFTGSIEVTEQNQTSHIYEDLRYVWVDGMILLYSGEPAKEYGEGVLCWVDPQAPEKTVILDKNWRERNPQTEIIVYVSNELSDAEARSVGTQINRIENVYEAVPFSREEALEQFVAAHKDSSAFSGVDASILNHRFVVTLTDSNLIEQTITELRAIEGVVNVVSGAEWEGSCIISPEQEPVAAMLRITTLPELPQ